METIKLYKFRSLGSQDLFARAKKILKRNEFWCASLWAQNDAMEGVYTYRVGRASEDDMNAFFDVKNATRISSFSAAPALKEATMWGHYANGLRGIAIEIEVDKKLVHEVIYSPEPRKWERLKGETPDTMRKRMLTYKLNPWRKEYEYRHFVDWPADCARKIGRITAVYFGDPLKGVTNRQQVVASPALQDYERWKNALIAEARKHNYRCYSAQFAPENRKWEVRCEPI